MICNETSVNLEYHKKTMVLILPITGVEDFHKLVNNVSKSIYSFEFPSESKISKDKIIKLDLSRKRNINYSYIPGNWRLRRDARSEIWNAKTAKFDICSLE